MAAPENILKEISEETEAILKNKPKLAEELKFVKIVSPSPGKITILFNTARSEPRLEFLKLLFKSLKSLPSVDGMPSKKYSNINFSKSKKSGAITRYNGYTVLAKPASTGNASDVLKPGNMSFANNWDTPEDIVKGIKDFIEAYNKKYQDNAFSDIAVEAIHELLEDVLKPNTKLSKMGGDAAREVFKFNIPLSSKEVKAEFFELVSGIRLAVLLRQKNATVMKVLGLDKSNNYSLDEIYIMFPKRSNTPLVDFFVGNSKNPQNGDLKFQVSVKSQVKTTAAATNTVKFGTMFDDKEILNEWYKSKSNQKRQYRVAGAALEGDTHQQGMLFPYVAMANFLTVQNLGMQKKAAEAITEVFMNKNKVKASRKTQKEKEEIIESFINELKTFKTFNALKGITVGTWIPEKKSALIEALNFYSGKSLACWTWSAPLYIVIQAFQKISPYNDGDPNKHLNFLEMFFDMVLLKKSVTYAKVLRQPAGIESSTVEIQYHSSQNFKKHRQFVGLRAKSEFKLISDALGLAV